ncbi:uncharacterized protein LOC133955047 [Platichthys flesus]|uniref:uncharacterized protein LOC133955047 n=1 Tax=Platichthys flesus TaxID=8260 RepID=UPI002DB6E23C|nr:uncharacterized protein LOC133955047 [Platichthys flesus]
MGSYRFHVPSIPEREAELQQEELNYSRCFQEASSNLTSPSYTSKALVSSSATSSLPHPPVSQQQQQQSASMENSSTQPGSQLLLADFHLSGSNTWQSPERTFNGATYGVSSQKSTALSEANKAGAFVPGPFQYGYNFLEEATSDSFSCEQNSQSQDFADSSIGSVHVTHNSFSFTAGEGENGAPNGNQFSNEQQSEDGSSYSHSPPSHYIQGVASSIQCPRNMSEDSASSDSSGSSSQQTEQGKTLLPESIETNGQADNRDATITSGMASRNYSYPPLQVPPMGLMMVSPYESPLPSPVQNHASSTCSSLSPASNSPVNISSEDTQMLKSAPPHTFYHQHQTKTQLPSDHLSPHHHQFHSDASRNLTYAPDRAKDDLMSYMQNSTHQKTALDRNKGYMDSFGVEHHQPPPPYSAHQLLATSLATANLDQLDVLLTCKQCDQNFNNLASFLGHKQYCAQHTFAQNDLKDISKMEDSRKFHAEPSKAVSSVSNVSMTRCPSDLHLSLLGLNKNGELMSDSETKGDSKDDPMKLNLFSGPSNIPVPLPDLEIEDAKLDSLITEALNGLGYQSDNAEIDSSFIDAFADDELTTVKATSHKQCLKTKESLVIESNNKQAADDDRPFTQGKCFYDSDVESTETGKQYTESKLEKISLNLEQDEKINIEKEASHKNARIASRETRREQDSKVKEATKLCKREDENASAHRFLLSSKLSERCGGKSFQDGSTLRGSKPSLVSTSPNSRAAMKDSKRKSSGGGTWSKELIHKIVQQKNKLNKLHVKGTKNLQLSLVMERLTPTVQNPGFGEYDYVSDSEDECEPVKIASQGRLNQSSRCKYTYSKECKWRARSERDQAAWRHESKECFEVKKSEEVSLSPEKHGSHQRLRRRGSRSSTSSELSTSVSVSSDSINSPKSTDRTDSDCEKKTDMRKKDSPEQKTYDRSSPQKLCKDPSTLALTFTKSVRKYNADKGVLTENKDSPPNPKHHSNTGDANPVSSLHEAKDTMRNYERSRISHSKSREKLLSHTKEAGASVSSDRDTLHRANGTCPKEEAMQSTDNKQLHFDSQSPIINKETDFNHDAYTNGKGQGGAKKTQLELSDCTSRSVCMVKEAITLSNELEEHKPVSLCTSLMDEVCLSPTESQAPLIQKDTLHLMPYPLDQEQGLMKSPLSFDTSSMFGELAGFDGGIYSDLPIQKEGFHSIESTSDKKEEFVSSFSPFLEQRDWSLIVSPVLPDEISQYKDNSEKSNEKKPDYNHVPLSLPEKIIDYSTNLNSCASEDELEIKRIVNELETQLQTTKLESPPLLAQDVPKQMQMSKFSPLRLSDESECDPAGLDMSPAADLSVEIVITEQPCSPLVEDANTGSSSHCSPFQEAQSLEGQHNLLILSQADDLIDSVSCEAAPFNDSLKADEGVTFDTIQIQEGILHVQDIKEHLPIDFMASHQNSPCREEMEESPCLFLNAAPSSSPLLSPSIQTPEQKLELEEDSCQPHIEGSNGTVEKDSSPNGKSPSNKDVALNQEEQLNTTAEMEFSLISPPHLDLGITESQISSPETTSPTRTAEVERERDPMYEFKLSPLNYTSIADEPPHLNQYNYIPISPAGKPDDNADMKQRDDCEPCDLSVNPALIFNKTETEMKLNTDTTSEMNGSDELLDLQQHIKFTCFSMGLLAETNSANSSAGDLEKDSEIRPDPSEPIEQLQIRADMLREDESVNLNSHKASAEDSALLRKDISDGTPTPKPLIICENEKMPLPPDPAEKDATIETGQCSITHKVHRETQQKKTKSDTQQGKVLCEICFMCFRTVPGLKRHKAMKHLVRAEKHIGLQKTSNQRGTLLIYESSQTTEKEHKDDSRTCYSAKIDGLSETNNTLKSKASETESAREEMATKTSAVAVDEVGHQNSLLPTKARKNNKARKNKNSELNIKPDPFSDEILNILKTDILQAITPEFKSAALQLPRKSPDEQVEINEGTVGGAEEFPVTSGSSFDNVPPPPTKDTNALTETAELNPVTHMVEMKCTSVTEGANGEVCADNNEESDIGADKYIISECDESRKTPCPVEEMCYQRGTDESLAQEILRKVAVEIKCEKTVPSDELHPLSCLNASPLSSPALSCDLKALLDDDTTFSQLFPRDEEAKRKKCTRDYSKRNKRQKLLPDSDQPQDYPPSETSVQSKNRFVENQSKQIFTEDQTKQCEYETISIDDAILLNMCHKSSLKADDKPLSDIKQREEKDAPENVKGPVNNLLNPLESTIDKSLIEWSGSTDFRVTPDPSTCKPEAPQAPCPPSLPAAPYPAEPCVTENVQPFHSIDIQSINTTFQLPEVQFFDSNTDISVAPNIANVDVERRDNEKSKKVVERRGRKRQDGGIKIKEKQYKCKVCFTWFLTLGELNFHKLSHNPSPPPTCYMCVQRKFSSREQLRDHLTEKHAKNKTGIWTCGMCLKEISDVWMYNEHLREHATQFARRGQNQGSILDMPGCFMQETAVKNFITSIMQHRPSKAMRDSSKVSKVQEKAAGAAAAAAAAAAGRAMGDGKPSEGAEPKLHKAKSSSGAGGKQSTLTHLEVLHNTETSKSVEMHPNCKDPSRDCHHCGKQFPKPFKLQRHLVVHNLEKIFLCHKCPVTYQEARALKEHLKRAHEEAEELDSKHTTLYTCELCADVMHVIKKSFICSTCNYTFSKKEQFDRHMEKHLSGGNTIFKFRGVLRPVKASAPNEDECVSPASKKRRILSDSLQDSSSDSGIGSLSSVHLNQDSETLSSKPFTADDSTQTNTKEYHSIASSSNVKTEDMVEDYSELLVELEKCIHMGSSESASPKKEEVDPTPSPTPDKEGKGKSMTEPCDVKEENESVCIRAETTSWSASRESRGVGEVIIKGKESSAGGDKAQVEGNNYLFAHGEESPVGLRDNQIISKTHAKHELAVDVTEQQRDDERWQHTSKTFSNDSRQQTCSHGAEQDGSCQAKDKAAKSIDNTKNSSTKAPESTPVLHSKVSLNTSFSNEDKESLRPQKKRKDMKSPHSLQRVSSPTTQENFVVDSRPKKKFRPSKCSIPSLQRKTDGPSDYTVLSSVRDDAVINKIVSKCKTANLGLQSKRSLLDSCTPKKVDIVNPLNGDYKTKKGPLGRSLHPPISKASSVPMNNSLNKSRPKMGVRSMESHSYRTAESQNHLLSQLFGQKLTSFKIPLRKDTSETIN